MPGGSYPGLNPALRAFLEPTARSHAVLAWRPDGEDGSELRRIGDLPDVKRGIKTQDLGRLHATGWLEDASEFGQSDLGREGDDVSINVLVIPEDFRKGSPAHMGQLKKGRSLS